MKQKKILTSSLIYILVVFLVAGCGARCERPVEIYLAEGNVKTKAFDGKNKVVPIVFDRYNMLELTQARKAEKASLKRYDINLFPGALLQISNSNAFYVYKGNEKQPLVFRKIGPAVLLGAKPICIDLNDTSTGDVVSWMKKHRTLKSVCSVILSGDPEIDVPALAMLRNTGVIITYTKDKYPAEKKQFVDRAITLTRPRGLIMKETTDFNNIIDLINPSRLTHMLLCGDRIPDLSLCENLVFYGHSFRDSEKANLGSLAEYTQIRTLLLVRTGSIVDLSPLSGLKDLQYLTISDNPHLKDMSSFTELKNLRSLSLLGSPITSVSEAPMLKNIKYLAISDSSEITDLSPLAEMKWLKYLLIGKEDLDKRKDQYAKLNEELPETEIVGFCMGSGWIIFLLPVSVAAGMILRRQYGLAIAS